MATKGENGFFDDWPDWSKPTLALAVVILLGGVWIGVPSLMTWNLMQQSIQQGVVVNYQPIATVLVAMTTATITGVFLFMTLRIDRGTRLKAESVAKREIEKRTTEEITKRIEEALEDVANFVGKTGPDAVREQVAAYLEDEDMRRHVESVLTLDGNVQIIQEYTRQRMGDFDPDTIKQLARLMGEAAKELRRYVRAERRKRLSVTVTGFFGKLGRSPEDG